MTETNEADGARRGTCASTKNDGLAGGERPTVRNEVRFHLLHFYRVLAIMAIVLHHADMIAVKNYGIHFFSGMFSWFDFRVDFLFGLSGFIITWLYADKCGKAGEAGLFLLKRLIRIYPLLFTLTSIKLLLLAVFSGGRWVHESVSLKLVISSYLMLPMEGYPLILGAWILPFEVCFYVIFALAIYGKVKWVFGMCMLWMAVIIGFHLGGFGASESTVPFLLRLRHLQIMGGVITAVWLRRNPSVRWMPVLLGGACLLFIVSFALHERLEQSCTLFRRTWWLLAFSALIAGSVLLEKQRAVPLSFWRWLNSLGDASYSIFLIHSPVLVLGLMWLHCTHVLAGPWRDGFMLSLVGCAIIAGVCCHRWLEKPLNGWVKSLVRRED